MAKIVRRIYTDAEKAFYVAEFERLYRAGNRTYASIARELGVPDSNYHRWAGGVARVVQATSNSQPVAHSKPRVVFTLKERKRLVAEVERFRATGQSIVSACREVGIGVKSFCSWLAQAPGLTPLPLREVTVTSLVTTSAAPSAPLVVVSPDGYRVEGLDVEAAARLLKALAC
jgi:transposase-like protein